MILIFFIIILICFLRLTHDVFAQKKPSKCVEKLLFSSLILNLSPIWPIEPCTGLKYLARYAQALASGPCPTAYQNYRPKHIFFPFSQNNLDYCFSC